LDNFVTYRRQSYKNSHKHVQNHYNTLKHRWRQLSSPKMIKTSLPVGPHSAGAGSAAPQLDAAVQTTITTNH
jgi:hypothetical protein